MYTFQRIVCSMVVLIKPLTVVCIKVKLAMEFLNSRYYCHHKRRNLFSITYLVGYGNRKKFKHDSEHTSGALTLPLVLNCH